MRLAPPLATALALLAAPALGQCLDERSLSRGVVVGYENGDATIMRRVDGGYVQVDETFADGSPTMRLRAHRGIWFVEEVELTPDGAPVRGTGLRVEFPVDPATLPTPAPGGSWSGATVNVFDDGTTRPETTTATFRGGAPLVLGGCSYEAVRVDLRYDWGAEGGLSLGYLFLPEIGTAIVLSNRVDGEAETRTVPASLTLAAK